MSLTLSQIKSLKFSWKSFKDYSLILLGALVQATALRMFLIPASLVSGGVSGTAQIIEHYTHWPVGLMVLVGNIPLFVIGWRFLGGLRFMLRTAFAVFSISFLIDVLALYFPLTGITDDPMLNALYGGVVYGIGCGMVYLGQGTSGGSDILSRILNHRTGVPISQSYIIVDALVVMAGGIAFGWELALYGMIGIYVCGLTAEMVAEGSNIVRSTLIVTRHPKEVAEKILVELERGVTILPGTGAYTGESRPILYCVVTRAEINQLKALVYETDPVAFMVVGHAYEAVGEGFKPPAR